MFRDIKSAARAAGFALALLGAPAVAGTIVDTGSGDPNLPGAALYSNQWLAAEFTVSEATAIDSIGIFALSSLGGVLTFALREDGGEVPGAELYSTSRTIPGGPLGDWHVASGLNWLIGPGSYWAAFEVRDGDAFMAGVTSTTPNPVANEAFTAASSWVAYDNLNMGLRITGTAAVPEPATWALLIGGFALTGSALRARRRGVA